MVDRPDPFDILIVGAGLSGLMAAHVLREHGLRVLVVDKGRSVGGRLATRRIGRGKADHGAQFFTVRSPEFASWVERWSAAGVVYQWSNGFSSGVLPARGDGFPRYAVREGMNALAKYLAGQLEPAVVIRVDTRVRSLKPLEQGWQAWDESGQMYTSRAVLLTAPVPQALDLLPREQLSAADRSALERITYAPCVAGLFQIEGATTLPEPGALQTPDQPISWIADNRRKGISPDATIITVHAGPDFSQALWSQPDSVVSESLRAAVKPFVEADAGIVGMQIKRWRYALPTTLHTERYLLAENLPPLALAGDAFGEPRVEGAALSGLAAGKALAARLIP